MRLTIPTSCLAGAKFGDGPNGTVAGLSSVPASGALKLHYQIFALLAFLFPGSHASFLCRWIANERGFGFDRFKWFRWEWQQQLGIESTC